MTSLARKKSPAKDHSLYPWGTAELTDKWVILHRHDGPTWAIYFKKKRPKMAVPFKHLGVQQKGPGPNLK